MILARLAGIALAALVSGCAYRLTPPAALHEAVRVDFALNQARLVRTQSDMQAAVATAIQYQLGWDVSPTGSAHLALVLKREDIQTVGTVPGDLPAQWNITIKGTALFTCKHGTYFTTFEGTGTSTGLPDESVALVAASQSAALGLSAWLDAISYRWPQDPVPPAK